MDHLVPISICLETLCMDFLSLGLILNRILTQNCLSFNKISLRVLNKAWQMLVAICYTPS